MIYLHGNDVVREVRDRRDEQSVPHRAIFQVRDLKRVRVLNDREKVPVAEVDLKHGTVQLRHVHGQELAGGMEHSVRVGDFNQNVNVQIPVREDQEVRLAREDLRRR